MSRPNTPAYKTLNWLGYCKALQGCGSVTIWFGPDMAWAAQATGKRGRQLVCSGEEDHKTVRGIVFLTIGCVASSCRVSASWHGTSIVRSQSSRFVLRY